MALLATGLQGPPTDAPGASLGTRCRNSAMDRSPQVPSTHHASSLGPASSRYRTTTNPIWTLRCSHKNQRRRRRSITGRELCLQGLPVHLGRTLRGKEVVSMSTRLSTSRRSRDRTTPSHIINRARFRPPRRRYRYRAQEVLERYDLSYRGYDMSANASTADCWVSRCFYVRFNEHDGKNTLVTDNTCIYSSDPLGPLRVSNN